MVDGIKSRDYHHGDNELGSICGYDTRLSMLRAEYSMSDPYLVITSWPDFDGARLQARHWLDEKLAASVNILPQMDSVYRWRGEIRSGCEHKIFIKTTAERLDALQREIRSAHPYAVAEILHFRIDSGDPEYLDWITQSTQ